MIADPVPNACAAQIAQAGVVTTGRPEIATRLFRARNAQTWPPVVVSHPSWPTIYAEAADSLDVLTDIEDAVAWTNNFIASLTAD